MVYQNCAILYSVWIKCLFVLNTAWSVAVLALTGPAWFSFFQNIVEPFSWLKVYGNIYISDMRLHALMILAYISIRQASFPWFEVWSTSSRFFGANLLSNQWWHNAEYCNIEQHKLQKVHSHKLFHTKNIIHLHICILILWGDWHYRIPPSIRDLDICLC